MAARVVVGVGCGDGWNGRFAANCFFADDSYDYAGSANNLLIVDAHGVYEDGEWRVLLPEGKIPLLPWLAQQPEEEVFLLVCNPGNIVPRVPGKRIFYGLGTVHTGLAMNVSFCSDYQRGEEDEGNFIRERARIES